MDFYNKKIEEVYEELNCSVKGLSTAEANQRIRNYGENVLKEGKKTPPIVIFLNQFKSLLIWILIGAVVISLILGDIVESVVILVILFVMALIGFVMEYKAGKAIEALKKLSGLKAIALRDGERTSIDAHDLVPGDIIFLETGNKVPADARIIESTNLQVRESSLTGESTPVSKRTGMLNKAPLAERFNMVFSGTIITKGRAQAIVTETGMGTEIGHIAKLISETKTELTPLQEKLDRFAKYIAYFTIVISIVVFGTTVWRGGEIFAMLENAVALAVAAIPEGLPAVVAIALSIGIKRMVKRNALIRKLPSVETLGSTTIICTDKTGTLTRDQMTVRKIYVLGKEFDVTGEGYDLDGSFSARLNSDALKLLDIGVLCNDAELEKGGVIGDPTEGALIVSAAKAGIKKDTIQTKFKRTDEIPFDSKRKMMSTQHGTFMATKGAPDVLLKHCTRILVGGKERKITPKDVKTILEENDELAKQALRVLGFAYKKNKGKPKETELVFVGLQAMIDPPRKEVKKAIQTCKDAGVRVVMITGDHKITAEAIARELGLKGRAVTGDDIDKIKDLKKVIDDITVFARVSPEHKLRIVDALQHRASNVVAMTGDGVNDAPALKKADIGIAMGIAGTDVAREASTMILTDDNFASIVNSVEEGRSIYDNITKFVYYLLSSNVAEVLIIFLAVLIGLPPPLIAIHLLWVNLMTDMFPALALGVEPRDPDIMKRTPRPKRENILNKVSVVRLLITGLVITAGTLAVFMYSLLGSGWQFGTMPNIDEFYYRHALTVALTTLVMFEVFNAIVAKSDRRFFVQGLFNNMYLLGAIVLSIALQMTILYIEPLGQAFHVVPLSGMDWLIITAVSATILISDSLFKIAYRIVRKT